MTERLLMGRKESNQTNKHTYLSWHQTNLYFYFFYNFIHQEFSLSDDIAFGSDITPCNKSDKPLSGLQILRKRYDINNNVAYIMTKL